MCIAIISTAHPSYPLILIDNRDEFLNRPTALADYWEAPNDHVLGGRDLQSDVKGTWLGVTKDGRVAVLTNFHEEDPNAAKGLNSRGAMVKAYLTPKAEDVASTQAFMEHLIHGTAARGTGGFSLICGKIGEDLGVVSNRTKDADEVKWIHHEGETVALSNAAFMDKSWPKVTRGETLMNKVIENSIAEKYDKERLIEKLFGLLGTRDILRPEKPPKPMQEWTRWQIFFSPFHMHDESGQRRKTAATGYEKASPDEIDAEDLYGTMKQVVLLVDVYGRVTYVERTWKPRIYEEHLSSRIEKIRSFEFRLSGRGQEKGSSTGGTTS